MKVEELLTVGHISEPIDGAENIYIGRSAKGKPFNPLCNPYQMKERTTAENKRVIDEYIGYFKREANKKGSQLRTTLLRMVKNLHNGEKMHLQCFCHKLGATMKDGQRCHGDIIREKVLAAYAIKYATKPVEEESTGACCHSGGAYGADYYFGKVALSYSVPVNHYYFDNPGEEWRNPKFGNYELDHDVYYEVGLKEVYRVVKMWDYHMAKSMNVLRLHARNWQQVCRSDEIFAVIEKFEVKPSGVLMPKGGTGYAIQMAINHKKRVVCFNQYDNQWVEYDYTSRSFKPVDNPLITKPQFAGIGSRSINESAQKAIEDLFERSANAQQQATPSGASG